MRGMEKNGILLLLWSRIEVVITRRTRNAFAGSAGTRVRIPPTPLRKRTFLIILQKTQLIKKVLFLSFISASPWWNLTIACVIIQVDILGLYARKEMGDVIFGFVS